MLCFLPWRREERLQQQQRRRKPLSPVFISPTPPPPPPASRPLTNGAPHTETRYGVEIDVERVQLFLLWESYELQSFTCMRTPGKVQLKKRFQYILYAPKCVKPGVKCVAHGRNDIYLVKARSVQTSGTVKMCES